MTPKEIIENRIGRMFNEVIDPDFAFIDECDAIADYIEELLYDTVAWQIPYGADMPEEDEDYANEMHATAMNQVIAILASRFFYKTGTNSER
jgi:hypothetical protein